MALPVTLVATEPRTPVVIVPAATGIRTAIVGAAMTATAPPKMDDIMIDVQIRLLSIACDCAFVAATSLDILT